jgi:hypothetical protein
MLHVSFIIYIVSIQIAISASNTGGAWDNAKKYIEVKPGDDSISVRRFVTTPYLLNWIKFGSAHGFTGWCI